MTRLHRMKVPRVNLGLRVPLNLLPIDHQPKCLPLTLILNRIPPSQTLFNRIPPTLLPLNLPPILLNLLNH